MSKIDLIDNVMFNLTQINKNFTKLKEAFNNKVLFRDNPNGEPNSMESPLDMNGNRIYNLPAPQTDHEPARRIDVAEHSPSVLKTFNNLSDVDDVADARANLGLGSAATSDSNQFATAAQGQIADSAVQPNISITGTGALEGGGSLDQSRTIDATQATKNSLAKADSALQSVVGGAGVQVDNTDPQNPIISSNFEPGQGFLEQVKNLSDLTSVPTARTNLGLGSAAVADVGTSSGELVDSSRVKQATGQSTTDLMSQKVVTDELSVKGTLGTEAGEVRTNTQNDTRFIQGGSVVQDTGASTTDVMSQKAVTDLMSQPSITGTVTASATYNIIDLSGLVLTLDLEVGDVIHVAYSDYEGIHTVEIIESDGKIRVNLLHGSSHFNGPLKIKSVVSEPGCTVKRICKWWQAPLGLGQGWVDVTGVMFKNFNRYYLTTRPFMVSYSAQHNPDSQWLYIDDVQNISFQDASSNAGSVTLFVPPGSAWKTGGWSTLHRVMELR